MDRERTPLKPSVVLSINTSWNIVNFRGSLVRALMDRGYDVVAVAPPDKYSARLEAMGCRYVPVQIHNGGTNPFLDSKLFFAYLKIFYEIKPFCYLAYTAKPNIYGSLAAHLLGIPTINNVAGLGTAYIRTTWVTSIVQALYRLAFMRARRVFFQNQDDLRHFVESKLVNSARATRIPGSGIDPYRYSPRQTERTGSHFRFILIGRLLWDKGVREYVEAARMLKKSHPDAIFQMLGFLDVANRTAVPRSEVESWVSEGLIEFLGNADDVTPFIAAADCVVLPSYREGVPRALLEASSMAKPIVTTDAVGCRDVVENGVTGLLAAVKSSKDLAEKMHRMISFSEEERCRMGQNGRRKMLAEFDDRIVIEAYLREIEGLERASAETLNLHQTIRR